MRADNKVGGNLLELRVGANGLEWENAVDHQQVDPSQREICRKFLSQCEPTKTGRIGSYGLKHVIENWACTYVSNGACIQAAIDLGLEVKPFASWRNPDHPSASIGVSKRSVRAVLEQPQTSTTEGTRRRVYASNQI